MIETRLTVQDEGFEIRLDHPHEIGDDLIGLNVFCDYAGDPNPEHPYGFREMIDGGLPLDKENVDELIAALTTMRERM